MIIDYGLVGLKCYRKNKAHMWKINEVEGFNFQVSNLNN